MSLELRRDTLSIVAASLRPSIRRPCFTGAPDVSQRRCGVAKAAGRESREAGRRDYRVASILPETPRMRTCAQKRRAANRSYQPRWLEHSPERDRSS
jgi:hypothetical protein